MLERYYNPKNIKYNLYGAKGIIVCDRWHNFSDFVRDITGMYNGDLLYQSKIIKDYKDIKYALDKDITDSNVYG
ncbi:hypothetical protein [Romboutsia sp. MSSM.1001216sp_RTP31141st1_G3_RTP31141_220114]|uniref:hypothetical protein n=1 Tax=unclassified Romboutsia TaxID=2626894 RepID=UPI0031B5E700